MIFLVLLFLVFGAPKSLHAADSNVEWQRVVAAAKKEGKVVIGAPPGSDFRNEAQAALKKRFDVDNEFIQAPGPNLMSKIVAEKQAGAVSVDAFLIGPCTGNSLLKADMYEPLAPAMILPEVKDPAKWFAGHLWADNQTGKNLLYSFVAQITPSIYYNTQLVKPQEVRSYNDLLDPKWKGKMSIAGTSTGVRWIGSTIEVMGREFLDKLAEQDIKVQDMSGAALAGLVASGEVPLSPTIFDADVTVAKQKGAPIEWRPLEPVVTTVGYSGLSSKASHPHAALLFLDYVHSKEGQQLMMKGGLWSPREDTGTRDQKFKKIYLDEKFSLEELEVKFSQWENLMRQLFVKRR
jgi:iron(III) transport system substrate-binding protein